MEWKKEEEKAIVQKEEMNRYLDFLALLLSDPGADAAERTKFMDMLKPDIEIPQIKQNETDIELLKRYKAMQGGG